VENALKYAENKKPRVLVVLPETAQTKELVAYLGSRQCEVLWVKEGQNAYEVIDGDRPNAIICALREPRIDGLRLLQLGRQRNAEVCTILVADPEDIELGVEAMRQGAYDFQLRPLNFEKVEAVLARGLSHQQLVGEFSELQRRLDERFRWGGIARRSSSWQRIYGQIEQVAQSKASVLIVGETGTGKGEVAKAIHQQSRRREQPFVEINCGALPEALVESELFGHEKGAFTGATALRKGRFELADKGTIFLDEVGDIPLPTQVKLLRAIQDAQFERVGGVHTHKVDVRILTATHRALDHMVEQGSYRADLYYRLCVITIEVPPLRQCREDIPLLVDAFIQQFAAENGKQVEGLTSGALDALLDYDWPGNVRELKNCIEGMVVMCLHQGRLEISDIPRHIGRQGPAMAGMHFRVGMTLHEVEKTAIEETLKAVNFNRRRAAEVLGVGLSTVYRKEKEYGIRGSKD